MGTDRDGLDSILAGNEEGAKGCCLSVDMTSDGIAVLSSDGYVLAPNGGAVAVCDHTYTELREVERLSHKGAFYLPNYVQKLLEKVEE